jgi:hypothetical protein
MPYLSTDNPLIRAENIRSLRKRGRSEADAVREAVAAQPRGPEELGEATPDDEMAEGGVVPTLNPDLMGGNTGVTGGMPPPRLAPMPIARTMPGAPPSAKIGMPGSPAGPIRKIGAPAGGPGAAASGSWLPPAEGVSGAAVGGIGMPGKFGASGPMLPNQPPGPIGPADPAMRMGDGGGMEQALLKRQLAGMQPDPARMMGQ